MRSNDERPPQDPEGTIRRDYFTFCGLRVWHWLFILGTLFVLTIFGVPLTLYAWFVSNIEHLNKEYGISYKWSTGVFSMVSTILFSLVYITYCYMTNRWPLCLGRWFGRDIAAVTPVSNRQLAAMESPSPADLVTPFRVPTAGSDAYPQLRSPLDAPGAPANPNELSIVSRQAEQLRVDVHYPSRRSSQATSSEDTDTTSFHSSKTSTSPDQLPQPAGQAGPSTSRQLPNPDQAGPSTSQYRLPPSEQARTHRFASAAAHGRRKSPRINPAVDRDRVHEQIQVLQKDARQMRTRSKSQELLNQRQALDELGLLPGQLEDPQSIGSGEIRRRRLEQSFAEQRQRRTSPRKPKPLTKPHKEYQS